MTYKEYKLTTLAENPELRKEYATLASQCSIVDTAIVKMQEAITEGLNTPLSECVPEEDVEW